MQVPACFKVDQYFNTEQQTKLIFQEGVPNLYEGDLTVEEEVLDWLTEMKVESHIELITRPMLETMVEETQYLAVFFCE